jgi:hypothetical protein
MVVLLLTEAFENTVQGSRRLYFAVALEAAIFLVRYAHELVHLPA